MELVNRLLSGDVRAAARLISIIENNDPQVGEIIGALYPHTGRAYVIGITGPPGAGKSTLVDRMTREIRARGSTVGIIAVDPSSPFTRGALLGDRIRMQEHATDPGTFIRSMASRASLGGLAVATKDAIKVLDALGKDYVIVETVGAGQLESDIVQAAHSVVVVTVPGLGDSIQAIKAGIMEIADIFVVNMADRAGVQQTVNDLKMMLRLGQGELDWEPPIVETIGTTGQGVSEVVEAIDRHREYLDTSGQMVVRRRQQVTTELQEIIERRLRERTWERMTSDGILSQMVERVASREMNPYAAAEALLEDLAY